MNFSKRYIKLAIVSLIVFATLNLLTNFKHKISKMKKKSDPIKNISRTINQLSSVTRINIRHKRQLENQLKNQSEYIFIGGYARSGTTLMVNLSLNFF